jgi:hypothetical protein
LFKSDPEVLAPAKKVKSYAEPKAKGEQNYKATEAREKSTRGGVFKVRCSEAQRSIWVFSAAC